MSRLFVFACVFLFVIVFAFSGIPSVQAREEWSKYGLYYLDPQTALVISRDGRPIEPKANDPGAPTLPGFHVGSRYFRFAASHFTDRTFSFRTERINGTEYSFIGSFGHEDVDEIPDVPFLAGTLIERHSGQRVSKKPVHFGHAVIL